MWDRARPWVMGRFVQVQDADVLLLVLTRVGGSWRERASQKSKSRASERSVM